MKKFYLIIIVFFLLACQKDETPEPLIIQHQPKAITIVNGASESTVSLVYDGSNITSYTPDNGSDSWKFFYNSNGQLSKVERGTHTIYEITYTAGLATRTDKKELQNNAWVLTKYYTYVRNQEPGKESMIMRTRAHNPESGLILEAYNGVYESTVENGVTKYTGIILGIETALSNSYYTWNIARPRKLSPFQMWVVPDMPICLLELPSLSKEVINGAEYTYRYKY